jgi:hypothetical protein
MRMVFFANAVSLGKALGVELEERRTARTPEDETQVVRRSRREIIRDLSSAMASAANQVRNYKVLVGPHGVGSTDFPCTGKKFATLPRARTIIVDFIYEIWWCY